MRLAKWMALLLLLPLAALAQVNGNKCGSYNASCTITLSATAGNTVVVAAFSNNGTGTTWTVTDTNSDTFTLAAGPVTETPVSSGSGQKASIYIATFGTTNASEVITITNSSNSADMGAAAEQYAGAYSVDKSAISNTTTTQTSLTTQSTATTSVASELLIGAFQLVQGATLTAGSGWTSRQSYNSQIAFIMEDQTVSSTGTYAATATSSAAKHYAGLILTLQPPVATVSPAAGSYFTQQSVTITGSSCGNIYYTTDGSTPTAGSTLYSGAFNSVTSGSETVKALCSASSTVSSAAYTIAPADVSIVSDDFSSYYDAQRGQGGEAQSPLDWNYTSGHWKANNPVAGQVIWAALNSDTSAGAAPPYMATMPLTSDWAAGAT